MYMCLFSFPHGQHKGTALEFSAAMIQEEVKRQCRMAFARVDQQKQNFEKRMKKQVVSPGRALAAVVQL
jgi:hypothetical protein